MKWPQIRESFPDQWLLVEAIESHTTPDSFRVPDRIAVMEHCSDGLSAMYAYRDWRKKYPNKEYYYVHTSREDLKIEVLNQFRIPKFRAT